MKKALLFLIICLICLTAFCGCIARHGSETEISSNELSADGSDTDIQDSINTESVESTETEETSDVNETSGTDDANTLLDNFLRSREGYSLGTNSELNGKIKVHLFFVDDDESSWDKKSVDQFTENQIMPGLDFLENEAKRYGKKLDFSVKRYSTAFNEGYTLKYNGTIKKSKENGSHTMDIPAHVAERLGYGDAAEMHDQLYEDNGHNEVVLLFLINKDGRSFAYQQSKEYDNPYINTLEYSVVFKRYHGKDPDYDKLTHAAATVAHEILHTYGAPDFYSPEERKQLLLELYKEDIMMLDYLNIDEMNVGEYTAYAVGWRDKTPSIVQ